MIERIWIEYNVYKSLCESAIPFVAVAKFFFNEALCLADECGRLNEAIAGLKIAFDRGIERTFTKNYLYWAGTPKLTSPNAQPLTVR